ncbi:MAG: ABC transporter ATP-binding protein [Verrucomicrobiae bacterium]|nr:ABC transporter ATP-binding protein [Verrucomicrobiae bacterium]
MASEKRLLKLEQVTKQYAAPGGQTLTVLAGIDFELGHGETAAVVGPSGSGKSTLLNLAGALDKPTSGKVIFEGRDLGTCSQDELADIRNRRIGFVFQSHHLLPQCTVWENVLIPTLATRNELLRDGAPERARTLLRKVGLSDRFSHRPSQLSGGERQRVAVVRALINEPLILLADEPTGSLDRASAAQLSELLLEMNADLGVALLVVTHSSELASRMRRQFELRDGKLRNITE